VRLIAAGALLPGPAAAQETEALRKELEQMRRQFEAMKEGYEKSINQLSERLKTIESRPPQPAPSPGMASPAAVPVAAPEQALSQASPVCHQPVDLAARASRSRSTGGEDPGRCCSTWAAGDFTGN
jgi:hypothetical protein